MSRINTNIPALRAIHQTQAIHDDLALRLERLSTGLRINRGRDDPAGLIVSEILRSEARTIEQAIDNSVRANNVITTTEGALNELSALLLNLQSLVVETSNEGGLLDGEVAANQLAVDSILASVDRIANTTTFGGQKLLDGSKAYTLSSVPTASLASVAIFSARLSPNATRNVTVRVTQSAQTASVAFVGTNTTGVSRTSVTTISIRGMLGGQVLSFASGATLADVRSAVNSVTAATGISAVVSSPGVAGVASSLLLNSTSLGSDAFISVQPIVGDFIAPGNANTEARGVGVDAGVLINGQPTSVKGLRVDVRSVAVDARIDLTQSFGQSLSSATFSITGGGAIFQLTPHVNPNGQLFVGFSSVFSTKLGSTTNGFLHSLKTSEGNDMRSGNFSTAQAIVNDAIEQISFYRGRLGTLQKDHIDPNINNQRVALENVTASESLIRDADMAVEVSALTRAQVLVQSTNIFLQIANSVPTMVLALLG